MSSRVKQFLALLERPGSGLKRAAEAGLASQARGRRLGTISLATAVALATVLAFVLIASRDINEPGLYPDELIQVLPALSFVKGDLPTNSVPGTGPVFSLGGHSLSAMNQSYFGEVKTVAFIPVAALFNISAAGVRWFAIVVAALALLATYAFARLLFRNKAVALVALVLLATDPSFIFYARDDFGPTAFMMLTKAVAGWQFLRWWDTGRTGSAIFGAFALGLGLYDKFNFIWVIAALAGATAVIAGRPVLRRATLRTVLICGAAFLVGCWPLAVYNLRSDLGTLHGYSQLSQPAGSISLPIDERVAPSGSLPSQLGQRARVLEDLLDGRIVSKLTNSPFTHFKVVSLLVALSALALCLQLVARWPPCRELRAGAFALLVALLILIAAAATAGGFHGHHVILTYPFPHLVLALVLVQAARRLARAMPPHRRQAAFASLIVALAATPVTLSAITTASMFDTFSRTGGWGVWSDGIYDLERYLARQHGLEVVTADWGLATQLVPLSQGSLHVDDVWFDLEYPSKPAQPVERLSRLPEVGASSATTLRDRRTWYVLRSPDATVFHLARRRFFRALEALHRRPTLVRRFYDRKGRPLFEIYSAEAKSGGSLP